MSAAKILTERTGLVATYIFFCSFLKKEVIQGCFMMLKISSIFLVEQDKGLINCVHTCLVDGDF